MIGDDKDQVSDDGAVELDEETLGEVEGGLKFNGIRQAKGITMDNGLKWKVSGFDGKANDVMTEDVQRITSKTFPKVE